MTICWKHRNNSKVKSSIQSVCSDVKISRPNVFIVNKWTSYIIIQRSPSELCAQLFMQTKMHVSKNAHDKCSFCVLDHCMSNMHHMQLRRNRKIHFSAYDFLLQKLNMREIPVPFRILLLKIQCFGCHVRFTCYMCSTIRFE